MIGALLWAPKKLVQRAFGPVIAMFESLNEAEDLLSGMTNEEIDACL